MFLGTQYYRPENPEFELWEQDFQTIKQLGMKVVRCWIYWRKVEFEEGTWNYADYDRFFDLAEKNGLKVLAQLMPESQPAWFLQKNSDLLPIDQSGRPYPQYGRGYAAVGGYLGLFYDHKIVADKIEEFYKKTVDRYKDRPCLYAWDVWNEIAPHGGVLSYDDVTTQRFRRWLQSRYISIENFNKLHRMFFNSFDQIPLPKSELEPGSTLLSIFDEFRSERLSLEMKRRADIVRGIDKKHLVVSHLGKSTFQDRMYVENDWELAKPLDNLGTSHYWMECLEGEAQDYPKIAQDYMFVRSATRGKAWWLFEHTGGQVYYHYGHHLNSAAETRTSILLAFAHGAEAAIYWQYRTERYGAEAPGWGLVNFDGSMNERTEATRQIAEVLEKESALFENVKRPVSPMGIIYDMKTRLYEETVQTWAEQGVSIHNEIAGWHKACMDKGISPDVYCKNQIIEGLPPECKILYLPVNMIGDKQLYEQLIEWVKAGGILIISAYAGTYDDEYTVTRSIPLEPLGSSLGIKVLNRNFPDTLTINLKDENIEIDNICGYWTHEILDLNDAQSIAEFDELPIVTHKQIGQGEIFYFATCPGIGYARNGGNLPLFIKHLIMKKDGYLWARETNGALCEIALGEKQTVFYLTNPFHKEIPVIVEGTDTIFGQVRDLLTGNIEGILRKNNTITIKVSKRDTKWIVVANKT